MAIMQDTAANKVACQELSHLQYGTSCQSLICGHKCHLMWSDVRIGSNLVLYLLLLLGQGSTCEDTYQYCSTYNAHYTKRIGACIAIGNGRCVGSEDIAACLGGGTQTWGVCYGTAEHTHHHGQVAAVLASHAVAVIEYKEEQTYAAEDIQQDYAHSQQVHSDASLLETFKEARTYLQAYAIDKQNQTEVLHEGQGGGCTGKTEMTGQDTSKKHKGDSQ